MNVECIIWRDSVSRGGWHYPDSLVGFKGRAITTIGVVVDEDESDIALASSIGDAGIGPVYCNLISIPKSAITERSVIMELARKEGE